MSERKKSKIEFFCKECGTGKRWNSLKEMFVEHSTLKNYPDLIGIIIDGEIIYEL